MVPLLISSVESSNDLLRSERFELQSACSAHDLFGKGRLLVSVLPSGGDVTSARLHLGSTNRHLIDVFRHHADRAAKSLIQSADRPEDKYTLYTRYNHPLPLNRAGRGTDLGGEVSMKGTFPGGGIQPNTRFSALPTTVHIIR